MDRLRRLDIGGVIFGVIILGVGVYYLLANTFGVALPELDWDKIWPLLVIALGLGILWGAWNRYSRGGHGSQSA
jgi:cell wall-active antibiotic response 4TMS protein YvqF